MRYASLFRLDLAHLFYNDKQCPDFIVTPTTPTQRLLKNHKCVLQTLPAGLLIRIAVEDDSLTPIIPLADDALFDFQLRLRNPDFALFTDLSALEGNPAPLYTNKSVGNTALVLTVRTARSTERFVVAHPAPEDRFVLGGQPLDGIPVSDVHVEGAVTTIEDDSDLAGKRITVNTEAAAVGAAFTVDYPVQPRLEAGVFADVALFADASMMPNNDKPTAFTITFEPKKAYWAYYFVTNLEDDQASFKIQDEDTDTETRISFGDSGTDLPIDPDPDDAVATMLAEAYPEMSRIRFVSDKPHACQQQPRKKVQLMLKDIEDKKDKKDNPTYQTLLGPLPNPSFHNPAILTGTDQTVLVQVIKYITHAFSTSNN